MSDRIDDKVSKNDTFKRFSSRFCTSTFEWIESISQALVFMVILFSSIFRIATVKGTSMLDTLHDKDKIFIWKLNYVPKNGDVVAITRGASYYKPLVKRVIATENQRLSINFDTCEVMVDGNVVKEDYILEKVWQRGGNATIPEVVPTGYTFVMGDNRNGSADSRYREIGLIPNENIVGKATHIIFPFYRIGQIN